MSEIDDDVMVPGDADDMQEALATLAAELRCECTLDDMLQAIDELREPAGPPVAYRYRRGSAEWRLMTSRPPEATVGPPKIIEPLYTRAPLSEDAGQVLGLLIAGGFVAPEKVEQARDIVADLCRPNAAPIPVDADGNIIEAQP